MSSYKTRSLRSLPPVNAPSLIILHGKKYQHQTFCIPSDKSCYAKSVPEMRGMSCDVCCYGWLLMWSYFTHERFLFNPVTLNKIHLPHLASHSYNIVVLTSPPTDSDCVVMFFSEKENSCVFCKIGNTSWIVQKVGSTDEDGVAVIRGYNSALTCKGKIYLFYSEGVAVVDVQDTSALIKPYAISREVYSIPNPGWVRRYFLEARGEIFQVCQISLGFSRIVIQKFDVFKLDLSTMSWAKVESLGDMIFLLSATMCSVSVSASDFGAKGNCIYFFLEHRTNLCCFDMEDKTVRITQPCPTKFPEWHGPYWVLPDCKMQVKKEVAAVEITENVVYKAELEKWKDLQLDHLELIMQSLPLGDCIRFRLACKPWMTIKPFTRPSHMLTQLSNAQHLPWLFSLANNKNDVCHFYHPIYTDSYVMNIPQLEDAIIHHAKFGWLLLTKARKDLSLFFFNPSTRETITLPDIDEDYGFRFENISFSAPPTSSNFIVFGHSSQPNTNFIFMLTYQKDKNRWIPYNFNGDNKFIPSKCNPVFHDGVFYSLSKDGKLGIFSPNGDFRLKVYLDLSVPDVCSSSFISVCRDSSRSFLTESDGEIFSVFMGYLGQPVSVYKLDQSEEMKWTKVQSLGDRVMFVSHTTSLLMPAKLKGTEDRIYLPRFKENASMFYSLRSGNYHSFGEDSQADWIDTCEHWNCTWLLTT